MTTDEDDRTPVDLTVNPDDLFAAGQGALPAVDHSAAPLTDSLLLTDEAIGHPALAAALRSFDEVWEQRRRELQRHVGEMGRAIQAAGARYRDVDA
jgi:hypothetical protein